MPARRVVVSPQGGGVVSSGPALPQYGSWLIGGQNNYGSTAFKNWSAVCAVNWFNPWDGFGNFGGAGTTPLSITNAIKAINPNTIFAQYAEPWVQSNSGSANSAVQAAANAAFWWLYSAYHSGSLFFPNGGTQFQAMDVMPGGNSYSSGSPSVARDWLKHLPDWTYDYSVAGGAAGLAANTNLANPNITAFGLDDIFVLTGSQNPNPSSADWLRTGTAQSAGGTSASQSMRLAYVSMMTRAAANGYTYVGGNLSQIATFGATPAEYAGIFDIGFAEGALGYSWSIEDNSGFAAFLTGLNAQVGCMKSTTGYLVLVSGNLTTSGADPLTFSGSTPATYYPSWTGARYGFGCTFVLLNVRNPAWFPCIGANNNNNGYSAANAGALWFDEMAINWTANVPYTQAAVNATPSLAQHLGAADGPGQLDATSGCYWRTFGGLQRIVIVAPKGNTGTGVFNCLGKTGKNFRFFNGTQDSTTNNGSTVSTLTISARDARVGSLV